MSPSRGSTDLLLPGVAQLQGGGNDFEITSDEEDVVALLANHMLVTVEGSGEADLEALTLALTAVSDTRTMSAASIRRSTFRATLSRVNSPHWGSLFSLFCSLQGGLRARVGSGDFIRGVNSGRQDVCDELIDTSDSYCP